MKYCRKTIIAKHLWPELKTGNQLSNCLAMVENGMLPVPHQQLPSGTIIIQEPQSNKSVTIYARVSSHDQKKDLDRQVARLVNYANDNGLSVSQTVTEIGSGLNGHRPKLMKLLADDKVEIIIVEQRDR